MPLATAIAATAMKHARHGDVHPHTALPFVVEHAGGINKEEMQFFRMRRDASDNKLNTRASGLSSWPSKGSSNFFLQSLPLANPKAHALVNAGARIYIRRERIRPTRRDSHGGRSDEFISRACIACRYYAIDSNTYKAFIHQEARGIDAPFKGLRVHSTHKGEETGGKPLSREETTLLSMCAPHLRPLIALSQRFRSCTGTSVLLKTPGAYTRVVVSTWHMPCVMMCSSIIKLARVNAEKTVKSFTQLHKSTHNKQRPQVSAGIKT